MTKLNEKAINLHKKLKGKLEVKSRIKVNDSEVLSLVYSPGVADVCEIIKQNPKATFEYTNRWNNIAIISDGSAVLGLGNIGPEAALPVMEGKAILFKQFGNIDAFPLCISTQEPEKIIEFVEMLSPTFGGINLEDISSPRCFRIESELKEKLNIPIFHDDQDGTAIVVLAALRNALKVIGKKIEDVRFAIVGIGAAGGAIIKLLIKAGAKNIIACDKKGILNLNKPETLLNDFHREIIKLINPENIVGSLTDAIKGADVFIGTSVGGIVNGEMIKKMARDPIVFALANPIPEISPEEAKKFGAKIVATGRSDYPNQVNNLLVFPGIFRGTLDVRADKITEEMKFAAVNAISECVSELEMSDKFIVPKIFDKRVTQNVAIEVARAAISCGVAKVNIREAERRILSNL
jgi:malate dehydrogenase (oxaloacetate-decarboxylating)